MGFHRYRRSVVCYNKKPGAILHFFEKGPDNIGINTFDGLYLFLQVTVVGGLVRGLYMNIDNIVVFEKL